MKRFLRLSTLFCFFFMLTGHLQARHILGGSVTYVQTNGFTYQISIEILRDCNGGGAQFDDPAAISIYNDQNELQYSFHENVDLIEVVDLMPQNTICIFPNGICVEKGTYIFDITLPQNTGIYTISYQRCCRAEIINNLVNPGEIGMTFSTEINSNMNNSSPVFSNDIPLANFSGTSFVYDGSATDADGDLLVYELNTPLKGGGTGGSPMNPAGMVTSCQGVAPDPACPPPYENVDFITPVYASDNMLGGNYPLVIDPNIGEMTATPTYNGVFQIGYLVSEYRNGELIGRTQREFMFVITPSEPGTNFDVSGTVYVDDELPLDQGRVELLELDISSNTLFYVDEATVEADGKYNFPLVPPGVHYLRAYPATSSLYFSTHLPTYYRDDQLWYDANAISECDTSNFFRDIFLTEIEGPEGPFNLGGVVVGAEDNEPVANLNLLLLDELDNFVQHRSTNAQGAFTFNHLPNGQYRIFVDLINSAINNSLPPTIQLNESTTYDFTLYDEQLELDGLSNQENPETSLGWILAPNPAKDRLYFTNIDEPEQVELRVFNIFGALIWQAKHNTADAIEVASWTSGLYFIEINTAKGQKVEKVMIN